MTDGGLGGTTLFERKQVYIRSIEDHGDGTSTYVFWDRRRRVKVTISCKQNGYGAIATIK